MVIFQSSSTGHVVARMRIANFTSKPTYVLTIWPRATKFNDGCVSRGSCKIYSTGPAPFSYWDQHTPTNFAWWSY